MQTTVRVIGLVRLSTDVEVKHSQSGNAWATGTFVHNEGSGDKQVSHFFRWKAFGETVKQLAGKRRGTPLFIEGNLRVERWKTKDTNEDREMVIVVISWVRYIRTKQEEEALNPSAPQQQPQGGEGWGAGPSTATDNPWGAAPAGQAAPNPFEGSDIPF